MALQKLGIRRFSKLADLQPVRASAALASPAGARRAGPNQVRRVPAPLHAAQRTPTPAIPDATSLRAEAAARGLTAIQVNQRITQGYEQFAQLLQCVVDPSYAMGGTSRATANWFAFAPHASEQAGRGMRAASLAGALLDGKAGEPAEAFAKVLDGLGLQGPARKTVETIDKVLVRSGLGRDVAAAVSTLFGAMNLGAVLDPRTMVITGRRFAKLFFSAPGNGPLEKARALLRTSEQMLAQGNIDIYSDVGGAAQAFLTWRQTVAAPSAERVLADFRLPGSDATEVRKVFDFAVAHAKDHPQPTQFDRIFPGGSGVSFMVAGFALYEAARTAPDAATREGLTRFGNNLMAYREQHDAVQSAFTPPAPVPGEVDRGALMEALTPPLQFKFGQVTWKFSEWSREQRSRDRNPLTPKLSGYNWAQFQDRWPPILSSFEVGYSHPADLWKFAQESYVVPPAGPELWS